MTRGVEFLARACLCLMILTLSGTQAIGARRITLETLLAEMVDPATVAQWPQPEFTCRQASSYDRSRIAPDRPGWFANHDFTQYLRTETHAGRSEQVMLDADGPGAIVRFWLTTNEARQGRLRFYFDGSDTAALEIPSYDLMASQLTEGPLLHPHTSYDPHGGGGSTLYLPIPYARHCKVTWEEADPQANAPRYYQIDYRTYSSDADVETFTLRRLLSARVERWRWNSRSLHFHAAWRHQSQVPTKPDSNWNFVAIQGQGLLVGDGLTVFNPVAAWYGEGNEKIWVDNETFPSHLGTGTEDYYNASWAPTPIYQTPFAGAPRIDTPSSQGNNTNTRTRNLDTIPFRQALRFDMEIEHWQDPRIDIGAVTYWYARPGAVSNQGPLPEEAIRPLAQLPPAYRIPGALECEEATVLDRSDGLSVGPQEMSSFSGHWSKDRQLLGKAGKPGDFVELHFSVPDGLHRLALYATRAPDYGILRITMNGYPAQQDFDGYAPNVLPSGKIDLGAFLATDGQLRLRVEVRGVNPSASGARYYFGLDCLVLDPAD